MFAEKRSVVGSTSNLLIVDPDIQSRNRLQEALGRKGRDLWFAGSCAEARALTQRNPGPDIAVVATELPDGCGVDLIPEIRSIASSCQCMTITARPSVEDASRAMRLGALDYLIKPFADLRAVANAVEWALARSLVDRQRHLQGQRIEESERRYALALEATQEGLWDWDLESNQIYLSSRWKEILGCEATEMGASLDEWFSRVHADDLNEVTATIAKQAHDASSHFEIDYRMQTSDGQTLWVRTRGLSIQNDEGKTTRMAGTLSDISRHKAIEDRLVYEALHDGLTRLSNRVDFHQKLLAAFARQGGAPNRSFAVLFVDLDRFKNVNDSLGHQAGDKLLLEIARRLQANIRESDCLARLGGDEFAILLSDVKDMKDVAPILHRIESGLKEPCTIAGYEIAPSASIGIAFQSGDCQTPDEILRNADIAMYMAKEQGRARAEVFDQGMHMSALDSFRLEEELRSAIATNQLEVHYQPIFDLRTDRLSSFEALVRWQHPERGWIPPSEFIAVAEDCELILPLGSWILRTACQQLAEWHRIAGPELSMSVNLSPKQVFAPGIVATITDALAQSAIAPGSLRLEITESVFIGNLEMATFILDKLRSLGPKLYLDDFGTGFSSLSYLNRLPFHVLKIDRSFVDDMTRDSRSLVPAIVTMAQALDIEVVAEGIESREQRDILCELGCQYGQGFLFSTPLVAKAATDWVIASRDTQKYSYPRLLVD